MWGWQGVTVMKECGVGMMMRNEIVQCGYLIMPLNRQVSSDQWKLYLFDHRYEQ